MRYLSVCLLALVVGASCARRHRFVESIANIDDPCTIDDDCRPPLVCDADKTCQPSHAVPEGEACGVSADCEPGLYCARAVCAQAGTGADGEVCGSSADCQSELYCAFAGLGGTCRPGGSGDIEDPCARRADCRAGLVCDWTTGECMTVPPPLGFECLGDGDCDPSAGLVCIETAAGTRTCEGLGPDGVPVPPWAGASCPDLASVTGSFNVIFEVPAATTEDFFRLPFPNDIRLDADLHPDLAGFPRPPSYATPTDLLGSYIQAIQADQVRFGPNQSVFLRTSHRPLFCAEDCSPSCATGCMGRGEPEQSIYVVDLTDDRFNPIGYNWFASSGSTPYICGPWIGVAPAATTPWVPEHTYAVFLHTRIKGVVGSGADATEVDQAQDEDFAALLSSSQPGEARLHAAWDAYQPLRDWLASEPTYPVGVVPVGSGSQGDGCTTTADCGEDLYCAPGGTCETAGTAGWQQGCTTTADCVRGLACHPTHSFCAGPVIASSADIGGAAVFTIGDPTETLVALGNALEAGAAPAVANLASCADATPPATCAASTPASFVEIQGDIALPIFQEGTAPYLTAGGNIVLDNADVPQVQGTETVTFSLSLPSGTPPAAGWPVVIYAHGTGGSFQAHVTNGVAEAFATASQPTAVLGIDQVAHASRRGGSHLSADTLFFNFANPRAAQGNVQQMAADQLTLRRGITEISNALEAAALDGLDEASVGFVGHSQGAIGGTLAMARASNVRTAVLSGAGGGLIDTLMLKTEPYDLPSIVRLVLADPRLDNARTHPALSLIQGYLEPSDPVNYGRHVTVDPLDKSVPKHVLVVIGVEDAYTPNQTSLTLVSRLTSGRIRTGEKVYVDDDATGLASSSITYAFGELPVSNNIRGWANEDLTVVATVHAAAAGRDGHFVLFDVAKARERAAELVATWVASPTSAPVVVP